MPPLEGMTAMPLASLAGQAIGVVVGLAIGLVLLWISTARNRSNQPAGDRRAAMLAELTRMRRAGASFQDSMTYLKEQGLRPRVAEGLIIDADSELEEDDLEHPQTVSKSWCSFKAPGNWRLQALSSELDGDAFFSVEGRGGAIVIFSNFGAEGDAKTLDEILDDAVRGLSTEIVGSAVGERLTRWGVRDGRGCRVTGTLRSHPLDLDYLLFAFTHAGGSASVSQGCVRESSARHAAAFDLIATSFVDGNGTSD